MVVSLTAGLIFFYQKTEEHYMLAYTHPFTNEQRSFNMSTFYADRMLTLSIFCLRFTYNQVFTINLF